MVIRNIKLIFLIVYGRLWQLLQTEVSIYIAIHINAGAEI
jgi:hypothetical protein